MSDTCGNRYGKKSWFFSAVSLKAATRQPVGEESRKGMKQARGEVKEGFLKMLDIEERRTGGVREEAGK